jgi:glyceraldehyde 3-phosphate dehydrogenase
MSYVSQLVRTVNYFAKLINKGAAKEKAKA